MNSIEIRPITEVAGARQLEEIQSLAWGMSDVEIIPGRFMHAMQTNGACLLGAYDGDEVVGFVFGLLGTVEWLKDRVDQVAAARLMMYSAIMGVLPAYQLQGVGYRLKLAQREYALRLGVRLITWTYDPLESRNGYFNIGKLGVICHRYIRDYHGQLGGINVGLPTDRFYVEWWVTSNRVKSRLSSKRKSLTYDAYLSGGAKLVAADHFDGRDLPNPPGEILEGNERNFLVEIPADIQRIKRKDISLATAWRMYTRQIFEFYFEKNYLVTDFVRSKGPNDISRSFYVLTQGDG